MKYILKELRFEADKTEKDYFQLKPMSEHYYLNQSGVYEIPGHNSKYEYNVLKVTSLLIVILKCNFLSDHF